MKSENKFFINSIIFDENPIMAMKQYNINNLFLDKVLILLNDFISCYNDMQMLDDYMAHNIYEIINYIKYNYDYNDAEEREIKFWLYNDFIRTLNANLQSNSEEFYLSQCLERGMYVDYNYKFNDWFVPQDVKDAIKISLCYDKFFYDILTKEKKDIPKSELSALVMNSLFIYSVNYFRLECPELLEKNLVLKEILMNNKKALTGFKTFFNKDANITKSLKKYSKQLSNEIRWS